MGIPTVADRLLQRAVARIIEAVFEADFLDCSYGFRPGRNPHHALQARRLQIVSKKVNHVFEADTRISNVLALPSDTRILMQRISVSALMCASPA